MIHNHEVPGSIPGLATFAIMQFGMSNFSFHSILYSFAIKASTLRKKRNNIGHGFFGRLSRGGSKDVASIFRPKDFVFWEFLLLLPTDNKSDKRNFIITK